MNVQDAYQTLDSIKNRTKKDFEHSELRYFEERGLVIAISEEHHSTASRLLEQRTSLFDQINELETELHGSYTSEERELYKNYESIRERTNALWHRFWTSKTKLSKERNELNDLEIKLKDVAKVRKDKETKLNSQILSLKSDYASVREELNRVLDESGAWRVWGVHLPWVFPIRGVDKTSDWAFCPRHTCRPMSTALSDKDLTLPESFENSRIFVSQGGQIFPYFDAYGFMKEAFKKFFRISSGDYLAITGNGNIALEGIEQARMPSYYNFDDVLTLVETILTRYEYFCAHFERTVKSIDWEKIDIPKSISRIKELRQAGKDFRVEFSPAYWTPEYPGGSEYFPEGTPEQHYAQEFTIMETSYKKIPPTEK